LRSPDRARDTVATETPARAATSAIVGIGGPRIPRLRL
jgi:hypothetical protein